MHLLQLVQTSDTGTHGGEVGQHAAQPSCVYIEHASALSFLADSVLSLLLGTNEQNGLASSSGITNEEVSLLQLLYGLLQIDNVDTVSLGENVLSHFRVPSSGLMAKVYASFQQLLHRNYRH